MGCQDKLYDAYSGIDLEKTVIVVIFVQLMGNMEIGEWLGACVYRQCVRARQILQVSVTNGSQTIPRSILAKPLHATVQTFNLDHTMLSKRPRRGGRKDDLQKYEMLWTEICKFDLFLQK